MVLNHRWAHLLTGRMKIFQEVFNLNFQILLTIPRKLLGEAYLPWCGDKNPNILPQNITQGRITHEMHDSGSKAHYKSHPSMVIINETSSLGICGTF